MRPIALLAVVAGVLSAVAAPAAAVPVHHGANKDVASFSIGSKITGVFDKVACESCKVAVGTFKKAVLNNPTEAVIRAAALTVCVTLKLASTNVCKQIIPEFAPWIFDIASKYKSEDICIDFLNAPCANKVPEWKVVFPKEKPTTKPPSRRTGEKKYLLHLSDWHFDPEYTPGLEAECGEPTCCRPPNKSGPKITRAAGKWGDYKCDTPIALGRSMLNHAASLFGDNVDYMLLTGDFPGHNVWQITPAYALNAAQTTADIFREYLDPFNITVFPAMGNHESSPVNSFPPANVRSDPSFWLYEGLANQWKPWLPESSLDQVRKTGSFSVVPREGLRVISINTNMCLDENWYLLINRRVIDQDGILDWMITELQAAEDNNERVIIIGHIPPGNGDCDVRWSQAYHQITERYQDIISAGFFGHRHKDSFQIHYNYRDDLARLENDAFVVDYVGPAVSPDVDANPSYRVYEVDAGSYEVLNTYTYIADISQQAKWGDDAEWFLEYDAKRAYGDGTETDETVLDAAWWHRVTERMARPGDRTMFDDFLRYIVRLRPAPSCDEGCRASTICGMRSGRGGTPCPANANFGWMEVTSGTDVAAISVC